MIRKIHENWSQTERLMRYEDTINVLKLLQEVIYRHYDTSYRGTA